MRLVLLPCIALATLAAPASAAPIRMQIEGAFWPGDAFKQVVTLPDDFVETGGSFQVAEVRLPRGQGGDWPVAGSANIFLTLDRAAGGPFLDGSPSVLISAGLTGSYGGSTPPGWHEWDVSTSLGLSSAPADFDIPQALVDLLVDPSRYSFSGELVGGFDARFVTTLHIAGAPAPAVPEPTTLVAWGVVGLGALAVRHRRRASMAKASAA